MAITVTSYEKRNSNLYSTNYGLLLLNTVCISE